MAAGLVTLDVVRPFARYQRSLNWLDSRTPPPS
jgi:hypothetical protein